VASNLAQGLQLGTDLGVDLAGPLARLGPSGGQATSGDE
jgi:hypothetical protein